MLKFIYSTFIFFSCIAINAQEKSDKKSIDTAIEKSSENKQVKNDSLAKKEVFGLRVGADLYKMTRSIYDKNYQGFEVVGDYRITKKHFIAGELGTENKTTNDDRLNFTTKGSYFKVGFDYNAYENWSGMRNMVYVGLRYGVSTFSQTLNSYQIYNTNTYFGEAETVMSGVKYDGLSAQWAEVVAGVKVEVFRNLYAGFSVRLNKLVTNKKPTNFDNLYIPGFNRTYDGNFGVGFNYTVSYFIPMYSVKSKKGTKSKNTKASK